MHTHTHTHKHVYIYIYIYIYIILLIVDEILKNKFIYCTFFHLQKEIKDEDYYFFSNFSFSFNLILRI